MDIFRRSKESEVSGNEFRDNFAGLSFNFGLNLPNFFLKNGKNLGQQLDWRLRSIAVLWY